MKKNPEFRDEIDFAELLRSPFRLFGYAYIYVLIAGVGLGLYYLNRLNAVGANLVAPVMARDSSVFVNDIPLQNPAVLPPVDIMSASVPSESLLTKGRDLFRANCSSCHGESGFGDGPAGLALNPKPRNFHSDAGWTNGPKISGIYRTLEEGIVKNGMASYNYLPPADRIALAHLVRSYLSNPPADTKDELMALETTYQLSKGTVRMGQIPIRRASDIYVREHAAGLIGTASLAAELSRSNSAGARLLIAHTHDPEKVFKSLAALQRPIGSADDLMEFVTADPRAIGFRADVASLDRTDWDALHAFLVSTRVAGRSEK
jgi:mono/diheme cytochrome c family protein